jgi:hypothetical protein
VTDPAELLAILDGAAAEVEHVAIELGEAGERSWSRNGVTFAVQLGAEVELRLGATIGDAAIRTPDTIRSTRGPEWVLFAPPELDDHAQDRLEAWFAAAWRRATN